MFQSLFAKLIPFSLSLRYDSSLPNKLHIRITSYGAQEEEFLSLLSDSDEFQDFKTTVLWKVLLFHCRLMSTHSILRIPSDYCCIIRMETCSQTKLEA